jgi:hypothetical protein
LCKALNLLTCFYSLGTVTPMCSCSVRFLQALSRFPTPMSVSLRTSFTSTILALVLSELFQSETRPRILQVMLMVCSILPPCSDGPSESYEPLCSSFSLQTCTFMSEISGQVAWPKPLRKLSSSSMVLAAANMAPATAISNTSVSHEHPKRSNPGLVLPNHLVSITGKLDNSGEAQSMSVKRSVL